MPDGTGRDGRPMMEGSTPHRCMVCMWTLARPEWSWRQPASLRRRRGQGGPPSRGQCPRWTVRGVRGGLVVAGVSWCDLPGLGCSGSVGRRLRARCAHALGITGASVALTTIGLAWLSNKLLRFPGGGGPVEAIAFLLPWLLAGFFFGSSYAGLLRNHAHASQSARLGSWFFSAACGAVLAALSLPLFLDFGVGRSLLLVCIACGLLATAVGRRSQGGDVKLSAAATVALAGISLLLGDMGMKPWLVVRHDLARRRSIGYIDWTAQGAVVVDKGRRSKVNYTVDQQPVDILALDRKGILKPVFGPTDLAYVLPVEAANLANASASLFVRQLNPVSNLPLNKVLLPMVLNGWCAGGHTS